MNRHIRKKFVIIALMLLFLGAGTLPAISQNQTELRELCNMQNNDYSLDIITESIDDNGRYVKIFDQPFKEDQQSWTSSTSEANAGRDGYKVFENFWDIPGKIDKIVWWGTCGYFDHEWHSGNPEGMNFYIEFYDDLCEQTNAPPKNLIYSIDIPYENVTVTHTEFFVNSSTGVTFEVILFEYLFQSPIIVSDNDGWVSIQSHDQPEDCWFGWINSFFGDSFSYQLYGQNVLGYDTAFQLFEYELDEIPPEVSIEQPRQSTIYISNKEAFQWPLKIPVVFGNIDITINASDPEFVGMDYVELYINDELITTLYTPPYTLTWDELGFGLYKLRASAYDKAGNSAATDEMSVIKIL
jgi:hypothetical protein